MIRCPSDLKLEAHLLAEASSPLAPHVASCGSCRARLDEMRRLGDEFQREVYPATVDAVAGAAGRRRPFVGWMLYAAPVSIAAAAAAILLLVQPRSPGDDYLGTKGAKLAVTVYAQAGDAARPVADGEVIPATASLRFRVRLGAPCRLWLVSVDAAGQVSRLYPPAGDGGAEVTAAGPLPGGAVLDGKPGPERIYAICSPRPLTFADLERSARAAAGGGETAVRAARSLRALPAGSSQATLLLEKRP
jgi:hypothetical protein